MSPTLSALRTTLNQLLLDSDTSPEHSQEHWMIEALVETMEDYEMGLASREEVRGHFLKHLDPKTFDVDLWIDDRVSEGIYDPD